MLSLAREKTVCANHEEIERDQAGEIQNRVTEKKRRWRVCVPPKLAYTQNNQPLSLLAEKIQKKGERVCARRSLSLLQQSRVRERYYWHNLLPGSLWVTQ